MTKKLKELNNMNKLNIFLVIVLITLSIARANAEDYATDFEPNTMTEEELDAELAELVDIKTIEGVKFNSEEKAE